MCSNGLNIRGIFSFVMKHVELLVPYCIIKWKREFWGEGGLTALF